MTDVRCFYAAHQKTSSKFRLYSSRLPTIAKNHRDSETVEGHSTHVKYISEQLNIDMEYNNTCIMVLMQFSPTDCPFETFLSVIDHSNFFPLLIIWPIQHFLLSYFSFLVKTVPFFQKKAILALMFITLLYSPADQQFDFQIFRFHSN